MLVLPHGSPGAPTDWIEGGMAERTLDDWAATRRSPRTPIVVMPVPGQGLADHAQPPGARTVRPRPRASVSGQRRGSHFHMPQPRTARTASTASTTTPALSTAKVVLSSGAVSVSW